MRDPHDKTTINFLGEPMLYQVNYKYVSDSNKLRSAACVVEAPDVKAANKLAAIEIKKEFDHFQITSTKQFGKPE